MNKFLLSLGLATALFAPQSAFATDLDDQFMPPPPVTGLRPSAYDWTGVYAGGWAGPACIDGTLKDISTATGKTWSNAGCGVQGGALLGFNIQMDELVLGVEADVGLSSTLVTNSSPGAGYTFGMSYVTTARARAGWAFDDTLIFITAGGVMGEGVLNAIDKTTSPNNVRATEFGWTAGVGIEQAITEQMRLRLEYDLTMMNPTKYTGTNTNVLLDWGVEQQIKAAAIFAF